jgi:uncharacterized repeat protein (TIGR03803 family)
MFKFNWWMRACALFLLWAAAAAAVALPPEKFTALQVTTLHAFDGTDGAAPYAGLMGTNGNFYGTTVDGGTNGNNGTVFSIAANGMLATLYSFCKQSNCTDGSKPYAGLVQGTDGNFYGTTYGGGAYSNDIYCPDTTCGTVFKITPSGTLTTLHSFCSQGGVCPDGDAPGGGLVQGTTDGDFYGTTKNGGGGSCMNGCGTVFKITPSGQFTKLKRFDYMMNGAEPNAGLVQGKGTNGDFYGTTFEGGANGFGTVFKITPGGTLTTLHNFDFTDGYESTAGLVQGKGTNGDFYGTTYYGGAHGYGTVFKITPSGAGFMTLYNFCSQSGCPDGEYPYAGLLFQATNGNFYGTTYGGGANKAGTIFKITPGGVLTTLYNFCSQSGCKDGKYPYAGLMGTNGTFYGTTAIGGANGYGTVFSLPVGPGPFVE